MKFKFTADAEFEATNAEDAARKLLNHFSLIAHTFAGNEPNPQEDWFAGKMELKIVE